MVDVAPMAAGLVPGCASYENLRPPPVLNEELKLLSGVLEEDGEGISTEGCVDLSFLLL